jgi:hypothetical protein
MGLWESLKGQWLGVTRTPAASSNRVEVAPGLVVSYWNHVVDTAQGQLACGSYVTEGLAAHGQKEMVLTLRQGAGVPEPSSSQEVFQLFATFQQLAAQGRIVRMGGITRFGQRKFLGRHLLYVPTSPLPGVPVPRDAIAAVLLTDGEMELVDAHGPMRVMASLGRVASYYPCPPWSELARPELPVAAVREASRLSRIPLARVGSVRVLQMAGDIVLRIAPGVEKGLPRLLEGAPEGGFGLTTDFDTEADAWLVWEPGQSSPNAITPPGSRGERVGGCFIAFVPGQAADEGLLVEDGFAWMLTDASWSALRRALTEGQSLALLAEGGRRLRLEWVAP